MYPLTGAISFREDLWKKISDMVAGKEDISHLKNVHTERAEIIMASVFKGLDSYDMCVNIPNTDGCISNMEKNAIVEVPAVLGLRGVTGISVGALPPVVAEFCNRQKAIVDLAVKAAVEGDRRVAVQALAIDPMVDDLKTAERIVEDGLKTFRKYLPAFN